MPRPSHGINWETESEGGGAGCHLRCMPVTVRDQPQPLSFPTPRAALLAALPACPGICHTFIEFAARVAPYPVTLLPLPLRPPEPLDRGVIPFSPQGSALLPTDFDARGNPAVIPPIPTPENTAQHMKSGKQKGVSSSPSPRPRPPPIITPSSRAMSSSPSSASSCCWICSCSSREDGRSEVTR